MGKTRSVANISSLVTTDLTNNFVGIGSTTPTSKLNVVGITSVGVGKSFTNHTKSLVYGIQTFKISTSDISSNIPWYGS